MTEQADHDFTALWQEYYPKLMIFMRSFFPEFSDREDAVQEIFTKIFKAYAQYNPRFKISTWIYRIARNYCIDCFRHKKNQIKLKQDGNIRFTEQNRIFNPEDLLLNTELESKVRAFLMTLEETEQQLCYLYHYECFSYKEISRIIKTPVSTVKYRMQGIHNKIKKEMEKYYAGTTK